MPNEKINWKEALRQKAEASTPPTPKEIENLPPEEISRMLHELDVQKAELEMQNDELRASQQELSASRDRYSELYHEAPVGYVSLDQSGIIRRANNTFHHMVERENDDLRGISFADLLQERDANIFKARFSALFRNLEQKQMEVVIPRNHSAHILALIQTHQHKISGEDLLLLSITDSTEQSLIRQTLDRFFENPLSLNLITDLCGTIQRANKGWSPVLGYEPEELAGTHLMNLVHPDDRAATEHEFNQVRDGNSTFLFQNRYRHKDGSWRTLLWSSSISEEDDLVYATAADITETLEHQAQLEQTNEQLNQARLAALNMMEDAMAAKKRLETTQFTLDHSSDSVFWFSPEGSFLYANDEACKKLGYTHDELLTLCIYDISSLASEDWPSFWEDLSIEKNKTFESINRSKDGTVIPVEINASFMNFEGTEYICAYAHDITQRRRSEAELRRLSTAIDQSPETIVITDTDGVIQYVNPAFTKITGYTKEEALGNTPRVLKSGKHDDAFYADMWNTVLAGEIWTGRIINKKKDGSLFTEEASFSAVKNRKGDIINFVAVKRDISKELEREEQFRQSQKMEAVGQLAGGVAHDFNNILQAILGYSEMLLNRLSQESRERGTVEKIQKSALRAADLVQKLLTFSRKEPAERTPLDLNHTVRDTTDLLDMLLGEKIEVTLDLTESLPMICADTGEVTQIIINLAVNARDAMPDGGQLIIATAPFTLDSADSNAPPEITPGDFACLSITDTGLGMSDEIKDRLFEPFFTTKEVGKGTGLGLSVVYGIVKQADGWLHVHSEVDCGTSFKVYLPVVKSTQ